VDDIELYYCGCLLHDDRSLESYGVIPGAVFMASKRHNVESNISQEPFDAAALQRVSSAIRIRTSRNFQPALEKTLSNPSTINNIVAKDQFLARDPIALALLQDSDLLMLTLNDSTARLRVFEAHPCLGKAVIELMKLVQKEMEQTRHTTSSITRRHYNMDQMDNEGDDDDAEEDADVEVNSNQPSAAAAAGSGTSGQWTGPVGGQITADFFRQAILAAAGIMPPLAQGGTLRSAVSAQAQPSVTEAQLQQLRDMGITDEALARRALEVSNGDIQAALEFIFGDDM
jgi:hypothetical protein